MPSATKVRWAQLKVGIMSAVALILLAVLVFLMTGERSFFEDYATVYTYLDDSYALTAGAPVRLNGILIGKIADVDLSGETEPNRIIVVTMKVRKEMLRDIPTDSKCSVTSENVLGTKYINIKKGIEIGAGIGTLTRYMAGRELVVATDINPRYLRILANTFERHTRVDVEPLDLADFDPAALARTWERFRGLIAHYQHPGYGFTARLRPQRLTYASDYDHLSRKGEWADGDCPEDAW